MICLFAGGLDRPPSASLQIARHTAFPVVATGALALAARAGKRRLVVFLMGRSASIPSSSPRFPIRKAFQQQGWISQEIGGLVM